MSPLTLLLMGVLVFYIGEFDLTDQLAQSLKGEGAATNGYRDIPLFRFLIGGAVAAAPLLMDIGEDNKKRYVGLVLLSLLMFNYRGVEKFTQDLRQVVASA